MSQLTQLLPSSTDLYSQLSRASVAHKAASNNLKAVQAQKQVLQRDLLSYKQAQDIINTVGEECQRACQEKIGFVVTRCLRSVFGAHSYEFRLVFENKRNQTEVRAILVDAEGHEYDILEGNGGGILDIASFGLRLACMMLQRPKPAKVLVLDEPMKMLSKDKHPQAMRMMQELARDFGVQIIMVTHSDVFAEMAENVIRITNGEVSQ